MRPMSLYESEESSGEVSLEGMFETPDNIMGINKLSLDDIAFLIYRGGWPRASLQTGDIALDQVKYYYDAVTRICGVFGWAGVSFSRQVRPRM